MQKIIISCKDTLDNGIVLHVKNFWVGAQSYFARFTPYQLRRIRRYVKGACLTLHPMYVRMDGRNYYTIEWLGSGSLAWR